MRIAFMSALLALAAAPAAVAEPARYVVDPSHTSIQFAADHVGYSEVLGLFLESSGEFVWDEETRTLSEARFTIQTASVFSNDDRRDGHLRGSDFLDAEAHPEITFVMTSAEETSETTGVLTGDLTLRGVTRPIDVQVTWNRSGPSPFGGAYTMGVTATAVVRRSDFGSTYAVEGGLVGDEIPLTISFEAIRQE